MKQDCGYLVRSERDTESVRFMSMSFYIVLSFWSRLICYLLKNLYIGMDKGEEPLQFLYKYI